MPVQNRSVRGVLITGALVVAAVLAVAAFVVVRDTGRSGTAPTLTAAPTPSRAGVPGPAPTRTRTRTASPPTGTDALGGNPIFADATAGFPTQECDPPGFPSDPAAGQQFYDFVVPCLDAAWNPLVTNAGLDLPTPQVLVPSGEVITSPCGTEDLGSTNTAAFYCPSNETLYMPIQGAPPERYGDQPIIYIGLFAHEFGHHVQNRIGTLDAEAEAEQEVGPRTDAGLELSRRTELQAQCFSGLFVGSLIGGGRFTADDYQVALRDNRRGDAPGDTRTHGTSDHSQEWWNRGGQDGQIGACNTWVAPSGEVS